LKIYRNPRSITLVVVLVLAGCLDLAYAESTGFMGSTVEFTAHVSGLPDCGEVRSNRLSRSVGPGPEISSRATAGLRFSARPGCRKLSAVGFEVDIEDQRIVISFPGVTPGKFGEADFNGFRLKVKPGTAPRLVGTDLTSHIVGGKPKISIVSGQPKICASTQVPDEIGVNLSGVEYDQSSRLVIAVVFATLSVKEPLRVVYGRAIDAINPVFEPTPEELLLVSIVEARGDSDLKAQLRRQMSDEKYDAINLFVQRGAYSERYIRALATEVAELAFKGILDRLLRLSKFNAFTRQFVEAWTDRCVVEPLRKAISASQQERTRLLQQLGDQIANDVYARVLAETADQE
jgi:hypothetical protein